MGDSIVGIVANPLSGRDIRRLVARASVFPTAEKANMIERMLTAFGAVGVDRVMLNTDLGGISAAVLRSIERRRGREHGWPDVEFLDDLALTETAADTVAAVRRMVDAGARVVICLGGDGTARVTAAAVGDVPMLALSTGTNNAFPAVREATVAGLAAGLVATGAVPTDHVVRRVKLLEVTAGERTEIALVDVAVSTGRHVGARALWDPAALTELYCAFAEPDAIGLSSIVGQVAPVGRDDPFGAVARIDDEAGTRVLAPIAPGLVLSVGLRGVARLHPGEVREITTSAGVIAVDGERELTFERGSRPTVRLRTDGPRCLDLPAVLAASARRGLLQRTTTKEDR